MKFGSDCWFYCLVGEISFVDWVVFVSLCDGINIFFDYDVFSVVVGGIILLRDIVGWFGSLYFL